MLHSKIRPLLAACLLTGALAGASALTLAENRDAAAALHFVDADPDLKAWGIVPALDIGFRLLPGLDTSLRLEAGGIWESADYWRLPDGALFQGDLYPAVPAGATAFQQLRFPWGLGIVQGLHADPARPRDDLRLYALYRGFASVVLPSGRADSLLAASPESLRDGGVAQWLDLSLLYDRIEVRQPENTRNGFRLLGSLDWAPAGWEWPAGAAAPSGNSYLRAGIDAKAFLPLYAKTSPTGYNLFSVYLAGHSALDLLAGLGSDSRQGIPFYASRQFGGLESEGGLGGYLRGVGKGWGDGTIKWVGNLEVRCNLPAFIDPSLMFGALAFVDAGAWSAPPGLPAGSAFHSGFLATAGLGVWIDVFGLGSITARTVLMLARPNQLGSWWTPVEFGFGMQF